MTREGDDVGGYVCFFTSLEGVDKGDFVGEGLEEFVVGGERDDDLMLTMER